MVVCATFPECKMGTTIEAKVDAKQMVKIMIASNFFPKKCSP